MFVSLASPDEAPRVRDWLVRRGIAARPVGRGAALVITDPWVPSAVRLDLAADPAVLSIEDTTELPHRVIAPEGPVEPLDVGPVPIVAGPCAVESRDLAFETAALLRELGIRWIRGGTEKTRTSPHAFQGHGRRAAEWLKEAAEAHGLLCVSEVTEGPEAEAIAELLDVIQVGARHMHSPRHLQRLGRLGKPVVLKRGLSASPEEWLFAAEYLLQAGAPTVVFCERGIRTAHPLKRFTLDLGAVPFIQSMTPYAIWVDPSHAAGSSPYVAPLARAALAAGAEAVMVECHPDPARACSDALQALDFAALAALVADARRLVAPEFHANPTKAGAK